MTKKNNKLNICLLFGGRSGEHEVSLMSAKSVYEALDKGKYNITLVGIDKNGHWHTGEEYELLLNSSDPEKIALNNETKEVITTTKGDKAFLETLKSESFISPLDVVFPVMHGTFGEDGSIQGFLELLDVAYVGPDVLGAAIGMDKGVMKRLLRDSNLPVGKFFCLREYELTPQRIEKVITELNFPIFVKPANLGSSVGITKAANKEELKESIKEALKYDFKVIFEEFIEGREIEISVLGNDMPLASIPGEIKPTHEFYDYEAKYIDENGAIIQIPASLEKEKIQEIQDIAVKTFESLNCIGMARVDMFLKSDGKIIINEINTIPGFTSISMYPKLWEASGLSYADLLDRLINLALERKTQKDNLKRSFK